jgi:hypothetical protein
MLTGGLLLSALTIPAAHAETIALQVYAMLAMR